MGFSDLFMGLATINKITKRRLDAIRLYVADNQPCSSAQIVEGTMMPNGKPLRNHKYLGLNPVEMSSLLMRLPEHFVGEQKRGHIVWRLREDPR